MAGGASAFTPSISPGSAPNASAMAVIVDKLGSRLSPSTDDK
jgi:hypothetical protein